MIPNPSREPSSGGPRRFEPPAADSDAFATAVEDIEAEKWLPDPEKESKLWRRVAQASCVVLLALLAGAILYMARNRWPDPERVQRCNDPNYHAAECRGIQGRSAERNYAH